MDKTTLIIVVQQVVFIVAIILLWYYYRRRLKNERLRSQNNERLKSVFLANESHSLRTPLNSIIGFSDLICKDEAEELSREQLKDMAGQINKNGHELLHFVTQLLELSNFESNIQTYTAIEVNLAELMASYRREVLIYTNHNVSIRIKTDLQPNTKATLDTNLMHQLMKHLLMNAVHHAQKGVVTLTYGRERNGLKITIIDSEDTTHQNNHNSSILHGEAEQNHEILSDIDLSVCKSITDALHGELAIGHDSEQGDTTVWIPCHMRDLYMGI